METFELDIVLYIHGYFCLDFDHPIDKERRKNEKAACHLNNAINIKF